MLRWKLNVKTCDEKVYKTKAIDLDLPGLLPLNFKKIGKVIVSE